MGRTSKSLWVFFYGKEFIINIMRIERFKPQISKKHILEVIKNKHNRIYNDNDFYRPIMLSINGSNYCNLSCFACSMSAIKNKDKSDQIPLKVILSLIQQAIDLGFLTYTLTVPAEPFLDLGYHAACVQSFREKIDSNKINTNCSLFSSYEKALSYMKVLKKMGWHKTNYFIPSLTLSLGMQQEIVPLSNIVWGITAFNDVFTSKDATLAISHYSTKDNYFKTLNDLKEEYQKLTKNSLPKDIVFKTNQLIKAGRGKKLEDDNFQSYDIESKVTENRCFELITDEYIEPGLFIYENGDASICPGFVRDKNIIFGNIYKDKLIEIIKKANSNEFYRKISYGGTKLIYNELKGNLKNCKVTNRHLACLELYKTYKKLL